MPRRDGRVTSWSLKDFSRFLSYFSRRPKEYVLGFGTMALSAALFLAMPRLVRHILESLEKDLSLIHISEPTRPY